MISGTGFRYSVVDGDHAWIVALETASGSVSLLRLGLTDGTLSAWPLAGPLFGLSEHEGLAPDGAGHLWLTAGDALFEIDEASRSVTTLRLPSPAADASPGPEDPTAGYAFADAWDPALGRIVFVRTGDHRLYAVDPTTQAITTVSDLPIETSGNSLIAVSKDGLIAINGQTPGATTFEPLTAVLPAQGSAPWTFVGGVTVCGWPQGTATISSSGDVTALRATSQAIGSIGAGAVGNWPPFACDGQGDVFTSLVVPGPDKQHETFEVVRVSSSGQRAVASVALVGSPVDVPLPGVEPELTFDVPDVRGLLPDNIGGVWVLDSSGASAAIPQGSYASIWRPTFVSQ